MARARDPNRDKAFEIWRNHGGNITNRRIAETLNIDEKKIAVWKQRDKWNVVQQSESNVVQQTEECCTTKKEGAPKGNQNARGNEGGAPKGNRNAVTYGFFRKFLPEDTAEIMEQFIERSPLDMLWDQIVIQYAAILRAQKIMYVCDQQDETRMLKKERESENAYERGWDYQQAWDKQATFLHAQSRAMGELRSLIKQYEGLCRQGLADEEQKLRLSKLKLEVKELNGESEGDAHEQGSRYEEALQIQVMDVFEVRTDEET